MSNLPHHLKKRLREYSMQAHENELKVELEKLALEFKAWETGEMGSGEFQACRKGNSVFCSWPNES